MKIRIGSYAIMEQSKYLLLQIIVTDFFTFPLLYENQENRKKVKFSS